MPQFIETVIPSSDQIEESYSSALAQIRGTYTPFETVGTVPSGVPKSNKIEDRIKSYYTPNTPPTPPTKRLYVWNSITNSWDFVTLS